jgi:hypothetical protein
MDSLFAEILKSDRRNLGHSEKLGCSDSAVAGNDSVVAIDQDRVDKAEDANALGNLLGLPICVSARVASIWFELF